MLKFLKLSERALGTKEILRNGTFSAADDGVDGYSQVSIFVPNAGTAGLFPVPFNFEGTTPHEGVYYSAINIRRPDWLTNAYYLGSHLTIDSKESVYAGIATGLFPGINTPSTMYQYYNESFTDFIMVYVTVGWHVDLKYEDEELTMLPTRALGEVSLVAMSTAPLSKAVLHPVDHVGDAFDNLAVQALQGDASAYNFEHPAITNLREYALAGCHADYIHIPQNILEIKKNAFLNANIGHLTFDKACLAPLSEHMFEGCRVSWEFKASDVIEGSYRIPTSCFERTSFYHGASEARLVLKNPAEFEARCFKDSDFSYVNSDVKSAYVFKGTWPYVTIGDFAFENSNAISLILEYPNATVIDIAYQGDIRLLSTLEIITGVDGWDPSTLLEAPQLIKALLPQANVTYYPGYGLLNTARSFIEYLDCYKLTLPATALTETDKLSALATLVYRDSEQTFVPSSILSSDSLIMQGKDAGGVVYVQDALVETYQVLYPDINFKGVSELALYEHEAIDLIDSYTGEL